MTRSCNATIARRVLALAGGAIAWAALVSCGGSGSVGNDLDSGVNKTYLSVEASDADGDALQYQWRVTDGTIENRNARDTVWTLPDGPGLHFAYVAISDGKGGWVEQQYAVSSDLLDTAAPGVAPITRGAPMASEVSGAQTRLRFSSADATRFLPPGGGSAQPRTVFVPDVTVQVSHTDAATLATTLVFAGRTDLRGELDLPKLPSGVVYDVFCATQPDAPLQRCGGFSSGSLARVEPMATAPPATQNLRLYGHVALADGSVCGNDNAFFAIQTAASVQLRQADGTAIGHAVRVNRFGDYAIDAAVAVGGVFKLDVSCEGYLATLDVPASPDPGGYLPGTPPIELTHVIPNHRPAVVKMVANGGDGNVRGRMIIPGQGTGSERLPGPDHFLTYKGRDTQLSACLYYQSLGAVASCDSQGNMTGPITLDDWKRKNSFGTSADVSATYINKRDLNLVRRMVATQSANGIAFVVCNAPGPDGQSQQEIDDDIRTALNDEKRVACVAMEYSVIPGANGNQPITQFYTFGPTGSLLLSINLDGRGEKYMPGSCVACHGGATYNGRFPEQIGASPALGSRFLAFDTGNFLFSSAASLTEAAQSESLYQLNQRVSATEPSVDSSTSRLIQGWYASGHTLDKAYVPPNWLKAEAQVPGAAHFYREVVGTSCRTCHAALGGTFDWDSTILSLTPLNALPTKNPFLQACGGTPDLASNASMPNALISSDLLLERVGGDPALADLMTKYFLGCSSPLPDPVYPKR